MIKDNYCSAVYKGLYVQKDSDTEFRLAACCVNKPGNLVDVVDFVNNAELKKLRSDFDQGLRPDSCRECWTREDNGIPSSREKKIEWRSDTSPTAVELTTLHYNVPPLCNAKCITCNPNLSSAWAAEEAKFQPDVAHKRVFNIIRHAPVELKLDLTQLQEIYFNGGEPMLSKDINLMLHEIKLQQGTLEHVHLQINTNCSIWPSDEDIELWSQCGTISILCSIEAVGQQFEYIRYPLNWQEVSANVKKFATIMPKQNLIMCMLVPNIGIHNVLEYGKLLDWFDTLQNDHPGHRTYNINPMMTGGYLELTNVSKDLKNMILEHLGDDPRLDVIRGFIENTSSAEDNQAWIRYLETKIDSRRNLNWRETFPLLSQLESKLQ
jgi:hypothetical protein